MKKMDLVARFILSIRVLGSKTSLQIYSQGVTKYETCLPYFCPFCRLRRRRRSFRFLHAEAASSQPPVGHGRLTRFRLCAPGLPGCPDTTTVTAYAKVIAPKCYTVKTPFSFECRRIGAILREFSEWNERALMSSRLAMMSIMSAAEFLLSAALGFRVLEEGVAAPLSGDGRISGSACRLHAVFCWVCCVIWPSSHAVGAHQYFPVLFLHLSGRFTWPARSCSSSSALEVFRSVAFSPSPG